METPIEIFFSYAHEDEDLMHDVRRQLVAYERSGRILKWHDRQIPPGAEWRGQIDRRLQAADLILLFVSPHFLDSNYCYEVEGTAALRRHAEGTAMLVPVILRPCSWQATPFGALEALPTKGRPVTRWTDRDEACLDVARGVMRAVDALAARRSSPGAPRSVPADAAMQQDTPVNPSHAAGARPLPNPPQHPLVVSDVRSLESLSSVRCPSPLCASTDVAFADAVEISSLKADGEGWSVHGVVQLGYCIHGRCKTCGRVFEAATQQIPVQFPELTCNQCDQRAFLKYRVNQLKRLDDGFEFSVDIRCGACSGRKSLSKVLNGLLHIAGITVGLGDVEVTRGGGSS